MRSVQHHGVTVAALASALAMLVSVSVMIYSFRITVNRWIQRRLVADIFVTPVQNEIIGFIFKTPEQRDGRHDAVSPTPACARSAQLDARSAQMQLAAPGRPT